MSADVRGSWIEPKARGIFSRFFGGDWVEKGDGVLEGRCPGESAHSGRSARTDARVFLSYGPNGEKPGCFCLHTSCKGVLEELNGRFRDELFARGEGDVNRPAAAGVKAGEEGVVRRAPVSREGWIPEFDFARLKGLVRGVEEVTPEWFMERSAVDVARVGPGDFLEAVFRPGERVLVFTDFRSQGDFLWEVGKGGYRLSAERGVRAVRSRLPQDGGKDGVWFLSNPVDGQWYANARREGRFSRRSLECVTGWRHLVVECDEEKTLRRRAHGLREGAVLRGAGDEAGAGECLRLAGGERWRDSILKLGRGVDWVGMAGAMEEQAREVPGLWMRFLAQLPLPILAIYSSGGYSLHALVRVDVETKADFDGLLRSHLKRILPVFGADPGAMTPVRLTRLPGCTRGGREQRLIYLNPGARDGDPVIRDVVRRR
jgi:hypothetical protein